MQYVFEKVIDERTTFGDCNFFFMMLEFGITFCCRLLLSSKTFYKHAIVLWHISAE
jgi:hypothetical protein